MRYKAKMIKNSEVIIFTSNSLLMLNEKIGNGRIMGYNLLSVINTETNSQIF